MRDEKIVPKEEMAKILTGWSVAPTAFDVEEAIEKIGYESGIGQSEFGSSLKTDADAARDGCGFNRQRCLQVNRSSIIFGIVPPSTPRRISHVPLCSLVNGDIVVAAAPEISRNNRLVHFSFCL